MERKNEEGQIALTIALIIAVVSAISLSLVSRSLTEVRLTGVDESASKAIRSAEAGVEQSLSGLGLGTQTGSFEGSNYTVNVSKGGSNGFVSAASLTDGEVAEIFLAGSTGVDSLNVYWGDNKDTIEKDTAALEVIKYQKFSDSDYRSSNYFYDPNSGRRSSNKFSSPTVNPGTVSGVDFGALVNIPVVAQDVLIRVKPLYNKARLGFFPQPAGSKLSDQFFLINAQGSAGGNVFRKIQVASSSAGMPEIFDMTLYAGQALSQ